MMVNEGEAYIARMASMRDERTSHYSHKEATSKGDTIADVNAFLIVRSS
jgi:hypothetical protein